MDASDHADAMLNHLLIEVKRALRMTDHASRAAVIAEQIQPYSGWALRWEVEALRARGMPWTVIAQILQRPYPTLLRQVQAGGPVYVVRPAHSPTTGNYDGQTPLRRAVNDLRERYDLLDLTAPGSATVVRLRDAVLALTDAQGTTDDPLAIDPRPLLDATAAVLAAADAIPDQVVGRRLEERAVHETLRELRAIYERDRTEIEAGHQVISAVKAQQPDR